MGYAITFGVIWAVLSVLAVLMLAAVPTSSPASNKDVAIAIAICGVLSALTTLLASGVINLFT